MKKRSLIKMMAALMMLLSFSSISYAASFTHETDAWDYGVQSKGVDFLFLDRTHRTYSNFYCAEQRHHATAEMDGECVRVTVSAGATASAYTSYHDSFSSTHVYYGHD